MTLVEFTLGGARFGIACELVVEVLPMLSVRKLPRAPEAIIGVATVRGSLLPLLDPRERLGLAPWVPTIHSHILSVTGGGKKLGLVVDSAEDVFTVPLADVCKPGGLTPKVPYGMGLVKRPGGELVLIDLDALVNHDEWLEL